MNVTSSLKRLKGFQSVQLRYNQYLWGTKDSHPTGERQNPESLGMMNGRWGRLAFLPQPQRCDAQIKGIYVRGPPCRPVEPSKRDLFDFLLTGLPLSRLWPLAACFCEANFDEGRALRTRETSLPWLEMCTCELSLSYTDPDVNRGSLMSGEVDKHGIDSPSLPGCRPQMASAPSTS